MRRLTYTPEVHAFINISEPKNPNFGKTIDVSQDIIGGIVQRNLGDVSSAELRLQNKNGKYLGGYNNGRGEAFTGYLFTPMDRIVITMARFGDPFKVFTGYLDEVPAFQLFPDQVTLRASCTLKRLLYTPIDPGIPYFGQFITNLGFGYDPSTGVVYAGTDKDFGNFDIAGSIGQLIYETLVQIGGWSTDSVNIIDFPSSFVTAIEAATKDNKQTWVAAGSANSGPSGSAGIHSSGDNYTQGFKVTDNVIVEGLMARGINFSDAIAVTGRAEQESAFFTRNVPVDQQGDGGFGLFQWTSGRADSLINFAKQNGGNPVDLAQQLDFFVHECKTTKKSDWNQVTQAPDIPSKVNIFVRQWEIGVPSEHDVPYAEKALIDIGKKYPGIQSDPGQYIAQITNVSKNNDSYYSVTPNLAKVTTDNAFTHLPSSQTILGVALSQLNVRETSHNSGPQIDQYLASAGTQRGEPWCAAFVYWVFHQVGLDVPRTAGVINMWNSLKASQQIVNNRKSRPQPGDMVFYGINTSSLYHMGIVTKVSPDGTFNTIEGNTGNNQSQDSGSVWVAEHVHSLKDALVYGFGRITSDPSIIGRSIAGVTGGNDASLTTPTTGGSTDTPNASLDQNAYGFLGYLRTTPAPNFVISNALDPEHALVNTIPLFQLIQDYCTGGMRTFCSGPDGDFYSFFPDYFGWFGTTPYFKVEDIEVTSLNVQLTDANLQTHVYGVGPWVGYSSITASDFIFSPVASVREKAFTTFINTNPEIPPGPTGSVNPQDIINTFYTKGSFDSDEFIQRYGARPLVQQFETVRMPLMLWLATWYQFLQSWANTYICDAEFTFMPELFPGGRINVSDRISFYIQQVTHEFDFQGGFTTSATLVAATVEGTTLQGEAQRTLETGTQIGK